MMILMLLASFFISFSTTEYKISKSQVQSIQTYYLAEAGVNEAIWRLKNDPAWEVCFTSSTASCNCTDWTTSTYKDTSALMPNSSYVISVANSGCGNGEISTNATSSAEGKFNQRLVKINIYKAIDSLTVNSPIFSGSPSGEITIHLSKVNVHNGNIFSNNNINVKSSSEVNVYDNPATPTSTSQEGLIFAVNNANLTNSWVNSSSSCSKKGCESKCPADNCPPDDAFMPSVDFNSTSSSSYKNKSINAQNQGQCWVVGKDRNNSFVTTTPQCFFTEAQFNALLSKVGWNGTLILEHRANGTATSTYYVTGPVELRGGRRLIVNGVLVTDGDISIGERLCWGLQCGLDQVTVNDPGENIPSGLLSQGNISFDIFASLNEVNIEGIVYAGTQMDFISLPQSFVVTGGMLAAKFSMFSVFQPLEFYFDEQKIREGIWGGPVPTGGVKPAFSPIITIDHWEEVY